MLLGKSVRMERILDRNTGRTVIVPMDHGVSVGPIFGLVDLPGTVNRVADGGANAVLMHKGLPRCTHRGYGKDVGLIVHLSASTNVSPLPNAKALVGTIEDALRLGADGVSVHINLGDERERHMLEDFGRITTSAMEWGMPVIAMMYARGPKVENEYDPQIVAHCARVGMEIGADIVKVNYTGDIDSFAEVCDACCVPVVIAGGPKLDSTQALVQMVHDSVKAGGAGLSMGRNVFQHARPDLLVAALNGVIHKDMTVEAAMELIGEHA